MNKSYYSITPANVRYDKDLTPNAKLLYGEITALCNEKGYCWATNSYFSELYSVSNKSVSKWINQLIEKKYISSKLIYKEGTKEIKERRLYIGNLAPMEEMFHTYRRNVHEPMEEKVKDNNTINNKLYKEIEEAWNNNKVGLSKIRSVTSNRKKAINARLKEFDEETIFKVINDVFESSFLKGENKNKWKCDFDWIFKQNNFAKILEGNYNKTTTVKANEKEIKYNPESDLKFNSADDAIARFRNLINKEN